jgi:hypothetical protein
MTLQAISSLLGEGGVGLNDQAGAAIRELQGLSVSPVAGAASNVKMTIAAIRPEDTILAAQVQGGVTTVGVSEVQEIDVDATGGVWTITWNAQTTGNIAYNATAGAVQTALEALSNIAPGDVVVTGGVGKSGGGTPYILTWSTYLGNVAQPTTTATGLTGGGSTATPSTTMGGTQQVGGLFTDDKANITIVDCRASGTITNSGGLPHEGDTVTVNGVVYTFKAIPVALNDVDLKVSEALQMDHLAAVINGYETRYTGSYWNTPAVVATSDGAGVVTVRSIREGAGNAPTVVGTVTTLAETTTNPVAPYVTCASVVADNTVAVNGVTFTAKAEPTGTVQFDVKLTDSAQAIEIARCINAYCQLNTTLDVVATADGVTVVITPKSTKYGNAIGLTENANHTTVSGSGFLENGTSTGGIKSTTNLTGESLVVYWYNKR